MIWNLDEGFAFDHNKREVSDYLKRICANDSHNTFKIGDVIEFNTGHNDHIRASARIKGIKGDDIYVYSDCYWVPIQDDERRNIKIIKEI